MAVEIVVTDFEEVIGTWTCYRDGSAKFETTDPAVMTRMRIRVKRAVDSAVMNEKREPVFTFWFTALDIIPICNLAKKGGKDVLSASV
jgi:hypothetical protein